MSMIGALIILYVMGLLVCLIIVLPVVIASTKPSERIVKLLVSLTIIFWPLAIAALVLSGLVQLRRYYEESMIKLTGENIDSDKFV